MELAERLLAGERRALAQVLTLVENRSPGAEAALRRLYPRTGRAHLVGVTGPPGSGKSTLANQMARAYRGRGKKVGIVAVDPTSPLSGGALLGDRIRMQGLSDDPGIFIRSMAARGGLGGLAETTADAVAVLDAYGMDVILVETVGAGQAEVRIARAAHTTMVVLMPGQGDEIQALKAGILEIADLFVVNKADLGPADEVARHLVLARPRPEPQGWEVPILKTVALKGEGVPQVVEALERHQEYLIASGRLGERRREQVRHQILALAQEKLVQRFLRQRDGQEALEHLIQEVLEQRLDPHEAAARLLEAGTPSAKAPFSG